MQFHDIACVLCEHGSERPRVESQLQFLDGSQAVRGADAATQIDCDSLTNRQEESRDSHYPKFT